MSKLRLSIYVTHGPLFVIKGFAQKHKENEFQILVTYSNNTYSIIINDKLRDLLVTKSISFPSMDEAAFLKFIRDVQALKDEVRNRVRLTIETNLGEPSGPEMTLLCDHLVKEIKVEPEFLVLFTDTPACAQQASDKLKIDVSKIPDRKNYAIARANQAEHETETPTASATFFPNTPPRGALSRQPSNIYGRETSSFKRPGQSTPKGTLSRQSSRLGETTSSKQAADASPPRNLPSPHSFHSIKQEASYRQRPVESEQSYQSLVPVNEESHVPTNSWSAWFFSCCCLTTTVSSAIIPLSSTNYEASSDEGQSRLSNRSSRESSPSVG